MNTIQIQKSKIIGLIASNVDFFGDDFAAIYVDVHGNISFYENYQPSGEFKLFGFSGFGEFLDENCNHPGSDEYDADGVAAYIINETDCLFLEHVEESWDEEKDDVVEVTTKIQLI